MGASRDGIFDVYATAAAMERIATGATGELSAAVAVWS